MKDNNDDFEYDFTSEKIADGVQVIAMELEAKNKRTFQSKYTYKDSVYKVTIEKLEDREPIN